MDILPYNWVAVYPLFLLKNQISSKSEVLQVLLRHNFSTFSEKIAYFCAQITIRQALTIGLTIRLLHIKIKLSIYLWQLEETEPEKTSRRKKTW